MKCDARLYRSVGTTTVRGLVLSEVKASRPCSPSNLQRAMMMRIAAWAAVTSRAIALSHTALCSASSRAVSRDRCC